MPILVHYRFVILFWLFSVVNVVVELLIRRGVAPCSVG